MEPGTILVPYLIEQKTIQTGSPVSGVKHPEGVPKID